ncbi:hypothetical protein KVF93_05855 [Streptococcus equi subsp. zooepidemicus]|uniref:Uncharacterized protein n=1 Tax=Streptococcus suis TaxID=1307 RepID=A0A116LJK1_STRSU|nr:MULTISPECIES: hypothetical protein [Streptococcus]KKF62390.1 hypothetical protein AF69_00015 [Streptococcus uberis 6736]MCD3376851.1 hypothetical protein [Streptococcus equi subsp. zooepidemicus]MCD3411602.1 hypothetical protein [Streptococcus equi subsp. zooepidemicus]MCD3453823.1 hypothetical protein [Streptococcus equi subsp. zooepidemicus]MCQ8270987.1 hypothetical protein [Streptococcus suis]
MNQAIKKRLEKLKAQTTSNASGIVFLTRLSPSRYEVRHQEHSPRYKETVAVYATEKEAREVVDIIEKEGDYIIFWDDIGLQDDE